MYQNGPRRSSDLRITDHGPNPFTVNIEQVTCQNTNFRTALWTGNHLQLTLMSIPSNGEIGLEIHPDTDQFLRIEAGSGIVMMGNYKDKLTYKRRINAGDAVIIPAGTWHNIFNTERCPLKIYSIYAPPKHPHSTVHQTKAIADAYGD